MYRMTHVATFTYNTDAIFCFLCKDCKYDQCVFPHTSAQYVKCGSISEEYKLCYILVLRIDLALFNIPVHLDTFSQTFTI